MPLQLLTIDNCSFAKQALRELLPDIGSVHMSEALAAAYGYLTHASLLAAIKAKPVQQPLLAQVDENRLHMRLCELGYEAAQPLDIASIMRSQEMPTAIWVAFPNRDRASNNWWFEECRHRNIPNVCVRFRTKYAELRWDCISIDPANEGHVRGDNERELTYVMFDRFQAKAKGSSSRPRFEGSAFVGSIDRLSPALAQDIADDFFARLYSPMVQRHAAISI